MELLPGVEFVIIGLLVREVVVVGIVAVDRQLVLERRLPFRLLEHDHAARCRLRSFSPREALQEHGEHSSTAQLWSKLALLI